jgi:class 3 adenylate cyclase
MIETDATLILSDISGFTEFMSSTELAHGSKAVNMLVNAIIEAVGDEYTVAELEGDAVFLVKKGAAPSKKELLDVCIRIFHAFHFQRQWLQYHAVCPCKACKEIANLQLKFVAHHGRIGEMQVGHFTTVSGTDVIIAHRLLKNSVPSHEYLLLTENLLNRAADSPEVIEMEWINSSDEYASIGKVDYRFALLHEARKNAPVPKQPQAEYYIDTTPHNELEVGLNFYNAYMIMMNIPGRAEWVPGLQKVAQDPEEVFIGSVHHCTFDDYEAVVTPLRMVVGNEELRFVESCLIGEYGLSLVYEYIFKNVDQAICLFTYRFMNAGASPVPEKMGVLLSRNLQEMAIRFKEKCEKV